MKALKIKFKVAKGMRELVIMPLPIYVCEGDELLVSLPLGKQLMSVYKRVIACSEEVEVKHLKYVTWELRKAKVEEPQLVEPKPQVAEVMENRSMTSRPERVRRKRKNGIS